MDEVSADRWRVLDVDSRGRCGLAKVRTQQHARYLVEEFSDGTLVLTPAELVPAAALADLLRIADQSASEEEDRT